jgi:hypothetical protein
MRERESLRSRMEQIMSNFGNTTADIVQPDPMPWQRPLKASASAKVTGNN